MARLLRMVGPAAAVAAWPCRSRWRPTPRGCWVRGSRSRRSTNAVDLDRFAPGPGDGAGDSTPPPGCRPRRPGTVRVGLVATFARWKGHEVFLDAVARIAADLPCRFYIVGGPIYRSAGSQYTLEELHGEGRGTGAGRAARVRRLSGRPGAALRALDVVVHASTRPEPFGRVIVEAMACGRAVVAVPAGGAAELFDDGVSALGCPPGDPAALARAIEPAGRPTPSSAAASAPPGGRPRSHTSIAAAWPMHGSPCMKIRRNVDRNGELRTSHK